MKPPVRVGIDVGGTFTDLLAAGADGETAVRKVPSTPDAPADGVVDALADLLDTTAVRAGDVGSVVHGSTVTTNALLERDGAETGLLVTDGFDAVPVVGRQGRPDAEAVNPFYGGRAFLVPPRRTAEVRERVEHDGTVAEPLHEDDVRTAARELRDAGVESIAVCYLFSFVRPEHERRTRELVAEVAPDCHVSLSSSVTPRIREYQRLSTTAIDAYVGPPLRSYLGALGDALDDLGVTSDRRYVMLSHGGLVPFGTATANACRTLLSGPAAGVMAGRFVGEELLSEPNLVTVDMGGTSCDVAAVVDGAVPEATGSEPGGFPLSVPTVDIGTIGAGGGTKAGVEEGRLWVGPESAGADPGPVCYGRGGTEPTVTDANVVLGRLSPDALLGGAIDVAADAAEAAVADRIGDPLGLSAVAAAAAVLELVTDEMRSEIRLRSSDRGLDPRGFALFAYGGAGPTHAARLAAGLGIPRVVVPRRPGVNSALGLLATDVRGEHARSDLRPLAGTAGATIEDAFDALERDAVAARTAEGFDAAEVLTERRLDLRYSGQGYEVTVPVPDGAVDAEAVRDRFDREHERRFGHSGDEPLEIVTYRVTSTVPVEPPSLAPAAADRSATGEEPVPEGTRPVYDLDAREFRETPVYGRAGLAGHALEGPAVVEQLDTTIVVEAGQRARFDEYGNAVIEVAPDG